MINADSGSFYSLLHQVTPSSLSAGSPFIINASPASHRVFSHCRRRLIRLDTRRTGLEQLSPSLNAKTTMPMVKSTTAGTVGA